MLTLFHLMECSAIVSLLLDPTNHGKTLEILFHMNASKKAIPLNEKQLVAINHVNFERKVDFFFLYSEYSSTQSSVCMLMTNVSSKLVLLSSQS